MTKLERECLDLWAECIKARANYHSELFPYRAGKQIGGDHVLNAHHLYGKSNKRLKFSLENGICLTSGEHNYQAHGSMTDQQDFQMKVKEIRGNDIFDRLRLLKSGFSKESLKTIKLYLESELKKIKES